MATSGPVIMVLMPTSRPCTSIIGPPEWPGLRRRLATSQSRPEVGASGWCDPMPMTTPAETAPVTPHGCPMARTTCPGCSCLDSPRLMVGRPSAFTDRAARSRFRSWASRVAGRSRPSGRVTWRERLPATWALMTIRPSECQMLPAPAPRPPLRTCTRLCRAPATTSAMSELIC